MQTLILGMVIFYGAHALPLIGLSAPLKDRLGGNAYKGLFAIAALVGLALMVWGFVMARSGPDAARIVYNPPEWGRHVTMLLVLLALISLAVYGHKGRLKLWLRHPMSIGVALWAVGHLFSNGNLSEVLFFGGFLALALADIGVGLARGTRPEFTPKPRHDLIAVVAGVVLFFVFLWLHPMVIGVSVT